MAVLGSRPYGFCGRKATLNNRCNHQSSGAVWKSRWPSWASGPNKPTVSVDVKQQSTKVSLSWSCECRLVLIHLRRRLNLIQCKVEAKFSCRPSSNASWCWISCVFYLGLTSQCLTIVRLLGEVGGVEWGGEGLEGGGTVLEPFPLLRVRFWSCRPRETVMVEDCMTSFSVDSVLLDVHR